MIKRPSEGTQKVMTYIAGYIALLPNGIRWYWGNISVYVYSYFYHKNKTPKMTANDDVKAPWLLSLYVISMSLATIFSGYINTKIGRRPTIILGIVLFDIGMWTSYFVFGYSICLLDFTMGILCGVGNGLLNAMILQTFVEWTKTNIGLISAFLLTSYAIGSVVTNQVITHYINPENKKVDIEIGKTHLFSQEDILDKVPSMFFALATISVTFHAVAFIFIRIKQVVPKLKDDENVLKDENEISIARVSNDEDNFRLPKHNKTLLSKSDPSLDKLNAHPSDSNKDSQYNSMEDASKLWSESDYKNNDKPRSVSLSDKIPSINDDNLNHKNDKSIEKSPREVIRSRFFYIFWFVLFGTDGAFMTLTNYYKVFGQVWIKDDHFLTTLGTMFAVFNVAMRLLWGCSTNSMGLKPALVTFTSGLALISAGYYFTPSANKWLFFGATLLMTGFNCGIYVNFIVAMHNMFGKVNFTKNYGLLASATIVLNLVFPPLTKSLLSHFGWIALFFFISWLNLCSLVLIVCTLPD